MTTDPFEEFEFRPLTEGLGFHRKDEKKAAPASFELKQSLPEIDMPLPAARATTPERSPELKQPLRRTPLEEKKKAPEATGTVDEILKTLQTKRKIDFADKRAETYQGPAFRTSLPEISSVILDGMLVVAASLACLIVLLMATKVDLFGMVTQSGDLEVYIALFGIFAMVTYCYLFINRLYLGFTPGEWVFDQRVGMPQKLGSAEYSLRVFARATLVVLTGIVVLPILSMIMQKDLAGIITGAPLLKKV